MTQHVINRCDYSKRVNYYWNNNQHYLEDEKRAKNSGYTENFGFGKNTNVGMTETINLLTY